MSGFPDPKIAKKPRSKELLKERPVLAWAWAQGLGQGQIGPTAGLGWVGRISSKAGLAILIRQSQGRITGYGLAD